MKKILFYCTSLSCVIFCLYTIWALSNQKMHDFEGKCLTCHVSTPEKNDPSQNLLFVDEIDRLCDGCHPMAQKKSHPIKIRPVKETPLAAHLDKNGLITCTTCHDVHKEDKTSDRSEINDMLWGHVTGRAFCFLCHDSDEFGAGWRHQTAIPYAHSSGKLTENPQGSQLDRYSTECLSCHDGTISKFPQVQVKEGVWRHGIGESHPVGIEYPRSEDFTYPESLPKEIRLFDGTVGCLSCHELYNKEKYMLVMDNRRSKLCFACHKK